MKKIALLLLLVGPQERGAEVLFAPTGDRRAIEKRIGQEIDGAKKEILVAVYQFTSKDLAQRLANAARRGVDVKVLTDAEQSEDQLFSEVREILAAARVSIRRVTPAGKGRGAWRAKFHHKFCVVDGRTVITGSFNWTVLADEENYENIVIVSQRPLAGQYAERFKEIWNDAKVAKE